MVREESSVTKKETTKHHKEITWSAAEYEHTTKDRSWHWMIGGAALFLIILALWQKNFFFAVFVALAAVMVGVLGNRKPQIIEFRATEEGIGFGKQFLRYENLESFAVRNRPGHLDEIILRKKTAVNPFVHIPIDEKLRERVQLLLVGKVEEVAHEESLVDTFSDWLGF